MVLSGLKIAAHAMVLPGLFGWEDLIAGRSAVTWLEDHSPVHVGARVPFEPTVPNDWPYTAYPRGLALAREALERLDYEPGRRYGLVAGLPNLFADPAYLDHCLDFRAGRETIDHILGHGMDTPIRALASWAGVSRDAPVARVDSACATGADALVTGAQWLEAGLVDDVLVVAASAMLNPIGTAMFHNLRALNPLRDLAASCPFDARRRGFVMGEGAAAVWLSRDSAVQPLACLRGYGQSMNADHFVEPPTDISAMEHAVKLALGGEPTVAYTSAHGTATPANDAAEARLHHAIFGERAASVPISSIKSMIGHCLGASALIEAIVCVEALRAQSAPPTINFESTDLALDLDMVPNTSKPIAGDLALSYSFAFGGHNNCLLFERGDT